jgi:tRNA threonylcarbamoyladenosine biosynthesis protein TsaE
MAEYISKNFEETKVIAQKVLDTGARIIALKGNLGAGKTALAKNIAEILGVTETVTSPTFVIMKSYDISHALYKKLVHVDAYRLESGKDLEPLRFHEVLSDENNLILIEWPELVQDALPQEMCTVQCDFVDEMTRKYSF